MPTNLEQKKRLLRELELYRDFSRFEKDRRQNPQLPTLADYITCRMGSSAVGVFLAFNEYASPKPEFAGAFRFADRCSYALGFALPAEIMNEPLMEVVWIETNSLMWM